MRFRSWIAWLVCFIALVLEGAVNAQEMEWVRIADPGNSSDWTGWGKVDYIFDIGRYEVTNTSYTAFLTAVAASDPAGLYNEQMSSHAQGGILRSGEAGGYSYAVREGFANKPVNFVSFWDSIRYANWLQNGMPNGEQNGSATEDGSYTITQDGIDENSIVRNPEADVFLPSSHEWYKAAHYDVDEGTYYAYPIGPETAECVEPSADTGKSANCNYVIGEFGGLTDVGATWAPTPSRRAQMAPTTRAATSMNGWTREGWVAQTSSAWLAAGPTTIRCTTSSRTSISEPCRRANSPGWASGWSPRSPSRVRDGAARPGSAQIPPRPLEGGWTARWMRGVRGV